MIIKMMKMMWSRCKDYYVWLVFLLVTDILFSLLMWLTAADAFWVLSGLLFFTSLLLFVTALYYICRKENEREMLVFDFLDNTEQEKEMDACRILSQREQHQLRAVVRLLRENDKGREEQKIQLQDYEEYIESWAHEVKTPLALMTLMLDNRKDEMSSTVCKKMNYACNQMQGYVDQILYYARLKAVHKNYFFEKICLTECCNETLTEFQIFFQEYEFQIEFDLSEIEVVTDKKSFCFMLKQLISNSLKYRKQADCQPVLRLEATVDKESDCILFRVSDNGIGVKLYDLPFLFEKGFSGEIEGQNKKTTGMGLYLVKQLAEDLGIKIDAKSEYNHGFEICFRFPVVQDRRIN